MHDIFVLTYHSDKVDIVHILTMVGVRFGLDVYVHIILIQLCAVSIVFNFPVMSEGWG